MLNIKNYSRPSSLEEAWDLMQRPGSKLASGMMWTRLTGGNIENLIDLQDLKLRYIEENEDRFIIGSMTTLRDLETNEGFYNYTCGASEEALKHIVGVQFRNLATVGGSICGKFGFSDVISLLLPLNTTLTFYKAGDISLNDFLDSKPFSDILLSVTVKKEDIKVRYCSLRKNFTDFPVITLCTVLDKEGLIRTSSGSRPAKALLKVFNREGKSNSEMAELIADSYTTGSNSRGSAEYRSHLLKVFAERSLDSLEG